MDFKLNVNHGLFNRLSNTPPEWWKNLVNDQNLYIDIRKDNYINVYYNGGSIMKLGGDRDYNAQIHFEYIPLKKETKGEYLSLQLEENGILIPPGFGPILLNNFDAKALEKIKKRIEKFYPNNSEKGLQGKYVTNNNNKEKSDGFFIDTEFQFAKDKNQDQDENQDHEKGRADLVWVDLKRKKVIFVELKTMSDARLFAKNSESPESVDIQLKKYANFAKKNERKLITYYDIVFKIKKKLNILPKFVTEESLLEYELIEKPILIIGDCTQAWIDNNAEDINDNIKNCAHSCIYQGKPTFTFNIPEKSKKNTYVF